MSEQPRSPWEEPDVKPAVPLAPIPVLPLDYQRDTRESRPAQGPLAVASRMLLFYVIGLIGGAVWSMLVYRVWFDGQGDAILSAGMVLFGAKFLVAISLVFIPKCRALGLGLMTSIPVGVLIFFATTCGGWR